MHGSAVIKLHSDPVSSWKFTYDSFISGVINKSILEPCFVHLLRTNKELFLHQSFALHQYFFECILFLYFFALCGERRMRGFFVGFIGYLRLQPWCFMLLHCVMIDSIFPSNKYGHCLFILLVCLYA